MLKKLFYHHAKFGETGTSRTDCKTVFLLLVCLSFYPPRSVMLSSDRVCANDFAVKTLEYRNDQDTVK